MKTHQKTKLSQLLHMNPQNKIRALLTLQLCWRDECVLIFFLRGHMKKLWSFSSFYHFSLFREISEKDKTFITPLYDPLEKKIRPLLFLQL